MPMTNSANFEVHVTIDKVNMEYVKKLDIQTLHIMHNDFGYDIHTTLL